MQKKYPIEKYLLFILYFLITTVIYFISMQIGKEGVTIQLFGGGDDGNLYWREAQRIANGQEPTVVTSIYIPIIGWLLKIVGIKSAYIIRLFNFIGFVLLVNYSFKLNEMIWNHNKLSLNLNTKKGSSIILIMFFSCYLSMLMNVNLSIYRDIWIYLLYLIATILSIEVFVYRNYQLGNLIKLIIIALLLGGFRGYALVSLILGIAIYIVTNKIKILKNKSIIITGIILGAFIYYTFFMDYRIPYINKSLQDVLMYRYSAIGGDYGGGSQMMISLNHSNFVGFIFNYIHSYMGNLVGPLPWHIKGVSTLLVFCLETIPMLFMLKILWRERKRLGNIEKYVLVQAFTWIALIAISNDNIGSGTRLRVVGWVLIAIVFSVEYTKKEKAYKLNIS